MKHLDVYSFKRNNQESTEKTVIIIHILYHNIDDKTSVKIVILARYI